MRFSRNTFSFSSICLALTACELPISSVTSSSSEAPYTGAPATGGGSGSTTGSNTGTTNPSDETPQPTNPWDFPYDNGSNPYNNVVDSYSVINKAKPVDVLFVMDNSGSMEEEQQSVVNSFSTFLEGFTAERIDYHIGVVATDTVVDPSWWNGSTYAHFPNAGAGSLLAYSGNHRFIKTEDGRSEALRAFRQNAALGIKGSSSETGLLAATMALSEPLTNSNGFNADFLRSDSMLEIVIVSDEDESMGNTDNAYIRTSSTKETTRINNFVNKLKALRPNRPDLTRVDFVIGPTDQTCTTAMAKGETYTKAHNILYPVANANNGKILNICTDFAPELGALGAAIAVQVERRFKISKHIEGALKVKLNGQELAVSSTEGYTWDVAQSMIELHGLDLQNKDSFSVSIEYVSKQ